MGESRYDQYKRNLNLKDSMLTRSFEFTAKDGKITRVEIRRFFSMDRFHVAAVRYEVTPVNYSGDIRLDVLSGFEDSAPSWDQVERADIPGNANYFAFKNKTSGSVVAYGQKVSLQSVGGNVAYKSDTAEKEKGVIDGYDVLKSSHREAWDRLLGRCGRGY